MSRKPKQRLKSLLIEQEYLQPLHLAECNLDATNVNKAIQSLVPIKNKKK